MTELDQWNRRARWCVLAIDQQGEDSLVSRARACLAHWRSICPWHGSALPSRELRAAAHQGLEPGFCRDVAEQHRRGCLVLSGSVGLGKTTAACWLAYQAQGSVLWLDAVRVALSRQEQVAAWLGQIRDAAFVMVDDVGAPGSVGQWESPKVAAILTAVASRPGPSMVSTNMSEAAFGTAYDAAGRGGRLVDRLSMAPNRWVNLPPAASRRAASQEPPGEDVLPRREQRAMDFLRAYEGTQAASVAMALCDVDQRSIRLVADRLGLTDLAALDDAVAEYGAGQQRVDEALRALQSQWARVVPAANEEPDPEPREDLGAAERRRLGLLDLVANVAAERGCEDSEVLAALGRTRRTVGPEDEPRLRAWLTGEDIGPAGDVAL